MRLLKVCINELNIYVDIKDDKYRLRVYEKDLCLDRTFNTVREVNRCLKELGLSFRVSEDYKKCKFDIVVNELHTATISFTHKGKVVYSTVKRKFESEQEANAAFALVTQVWESVYDEKVSKFTAKDAWNAFIE